MAKTKSSGFKQNTGVKASQIVGKLSKQDSSDPKFKLVKSPKNPRVNQQ